VMAADPAALQLRLLQTVVEVAAEKNSTLVMPVPVELLRFFDRTAQPAAQQRPADADIKDADGPPPAVELPAVELPALAMPAGIPASPARDAAPLNAAPKTPATA
jgi:hypothetical protein